MKPHGTSEVLLDLVKDEILHFAIKRGSFTLVSGATSDFYVDCKKALLYATTLSYYATIVLETLWSFGPLPQALAGVALGGVPLATGVATAHVILEPDDPMGIVIVRKQTKEHGSANRVEYPERLGVGRRDVEAVLLEDVVTSGGSALRAVAALREVGITVRRCIAVIDREEGGVQAMEKAGMDVTALFRKSDFLEEGAKP